MLGAWELACLSCFNGTRECRRCRGAEYGHNNKRARDRMRVGRRTMYNVKCHLATLVNLAIPDPVLFFLS